MKSPFPYKNKKGDGDFLNGMTRNSISILVFTSNEMSTHFGLCLERNHFKTGCFCKASKLCAGIQPYISMTAQMSQWRLEFYKKSSRRNIFFKSAQTIHDAWRNCICSFAACPLLKF